MSSENRTEKPTPKKRADARRQGQVARSSEINSAAVLFATFGALAITGPRLVSQLEDVLRRGLERSGNAQELIPAGLSTIAIDSAKAFASATAPVLLAALAAGVLANVAQVGFRVTPKAIKPSFKKINPLAGFKRLFGPQSLVETAKAVAKASIVGAAAFVAVWPKLPEFGALVGLSPAEVLGHTAGSIRSLTLIVGSAFLLVAVLDYVYQRFRNEKSLKMSRDDLKQEGRQSELAPEIRGAIKRRQMEQARKRMLADVPTADVVVTNPTHFAVALRYDGKQPAPEVVAKGADLVAAAIRRTAEEAGVPILSNPPLARSLYREVEIGRMIPEELFAAVAEVLAYVYRRAGRLRNSA